MSLTVRPELGEVDWTFIRTLNARLTAEIDAPAHSDDQIAEFQDRFTATAWEGENGTGATFLAEQENGDRLGYVNVRKGHDDIADEACAYIALLAVVPEAEGRGVASALLEQAESWARQNGYNRLSLDVFASNAKAQRFYEKANFRPETIRMIKTI